MALAQLLPGLCLAAFATLLGWGLARAFEPVPARVWTLGAGLVLALFAPVLLGGRVLLPLDHLETFPPYGPLPEELVETADGNPLQSDLVNQITPWRSLVRRAFADGRWPLWNPTAAAGSPLAANPQAQIFQPFTVLSLPLPLPVAAGVTAAAKILTAYLFFFLFARRQGLSDGSATVGALAYGLSAFLVLYVGWPLSNQAALLPLVLYAVISFDERRRREDLLLLALGFFAILNGGHPETIAYVLLVAAAFAAARLVARIRDGGLQPEGRRDLLRLVGGWGAAALLAGLLAAPLLLPTLSYMPQMDRFHATSVQGELLGTRDPLAPWRHEAGRRDQLRRLALRTVPLAAPNAYGNERWGAYWGGLTVNASTAGFAGSLTLLAALAGMGAWLRRRSALHFREEGLVGALAGVALLTAVQFPGYAQLVVHLPLLGRSATLHRRFLLVLAFALAFLAAAALERLVREGLPRGPVLAAAFGLGAFVAWGYLAHPSPEGPRVLGWLRTGSLALQLAVLVAGACLLASGRGRPRSRAALWLAGLLVAGELLAFHRPANPGLPPELFYPETPPLALLENRLGDGQPYRMVGLGHALPPEMAAIHDLPDIRTLGPTNPGAHLRLLEPVLPRRRVSTLLHRTDHPVLDLLGVRYALAPPDWRGSTAGLVRLPTEGDEHGLVFERPSALPLLFLPAQAVLPRPDEPWWQQVGTHGGFAAQSLVSELPEGSPAPGWRAARPGDSSLEIEPLETEHVRAQALLVESRLLATSIYQDGGWHLLADGPGSPDTPFSTVHANGPMVAVWLPPGDHALHLLYRPPGFLLGCLAAALGIAGTAAVASRRPGMVRSESARSTDDTTYGGSTWRLRRAPLARSRPDGDRRHRHPGRRSAAQGDLTLRLGRS